MELFIFDVALAVLLLGSCLYGLLLVRRQKRQLKLMLAYNAVMLCFIRDAYMMRMTPLGRALFDAYLEGVRQDTEMNKEGS